MEPTDTATIWAATIGAHATVRAAWIQFGAASLAAAGALIAGRWAYLGATRQVRLQEEQASARTTAYKSRLRAIVGQVQNQVGADLAIAIWQQSLYEENDVSEVLKAVPYNVPEQMKPEHWEEHSMLGDRAVRALQAAYEELENAIRFNEEMRGKSLDDVSERPIFNDIMEAEPAASQHVETAQRLYNALADLLTLLEPGRRVMRDHTRLKRLPKWFRRWKVRLQRTSRAP
jgi:hypothetical protein